MQKTKQKNAMWVKTEDSALFEEAYFLPVSYTHLTLPTIEPV